MAISLDYKPLEGDEKLSPTDLAERLKTDAAQLIKSKVQITGPEVFSSFIRQVYLRQIDTRWQNHLEELEDLRDSVSLRSFAQKNPLIEYKLEGSDIFDRMIDQIKSSVAKTVIRVQIRTDAPAPRSAAQRRITETHREGLSFGAMAATHQQTARQSANAGAVSPVQVIRSAPKVGRNDPCPCGSGKKYKNCCGRNQGTT